MYIYPLFITSSKEVPTELFAFSLTQTILKKGGNISNVFLNSVALKIEVICSFPFYFSVEHCCRSIYKSMKYCKIMKWKATVPQYLFRLRMTNCTWLAISYERCA